jgi:hypothetical protein
VRKPDLVGQVERACLALSAAGRAVTFGEVAERAGVGKATLYRRSELRALVEEYRLRSREALTLSGLAVEVDQLRGSLEAVAARVRRQDEVLRRLTRRSADSSNE